MGTKRSAGYEEIPRTGFYYSRPLWLVKKQLTQTHPQTDQKVSQTLNVMTEKKLRQIAMSLEHVSEEPHFEKTSFRIKKKIFASYDSKKKRVCVKLTVIDQASFCSFDKQVIYPVPNKW